MTIYASALTIAVFAQQPDSTNSSDYKTNFQVPNPSVGVPEDSQSVYTPQYSPPQQQQTSPIIQQRPLSQPSLQYPKQESQPGLRLQPLQTNPQIPSQTQPLEMDQSGNQNQFNRSVQPSLPESDTQRPR